MEKSELAKIAAKNGVPMAIVEKDYALSLVLSAIYESNLAANLIFKGGTAIKKVYFKEARFSEDLDFTVLELDKNKIMEELGNMGLGKETGIIFEKPVEERTTEGLKVTVKYTGPLGHPQRVRLDFSFRDNVLGEPARTELIDTYGLGRQEVLVLTLGELFAEKVHALGSRSAPRDLYDIWFLASNGVTMDRALIEKKFEYYGERLEKEKILAAIRQMRDNWKIDLQQFMKQVPPLEMVENEVMRMLEKEFPDV